MKIIQYLILVLILTNLFFVVGCGSAEKADSKTESSQDQKTEEETGINDVFEDTGEVSPPEIPD